MKTRSPVADYTIGIIFWMTLYVAAIVFDGFYFRNRFGTPTSPLLYVFAVLPSIPIGGTILVMLRYIKKADEYVSALITHRFIVATGLTLFICSAWGFLENYANVQHFDLYYVYILFWMSFGVVSAFMRGVK